MEIVFFYLSNFTKKSRHFNSVPPPSFVTSTPGVIPQYNKTDVWFYCKYDLSPDNLFYQVQWELQGETYLLITKQYCNEDNVTLCNLYADDFNVALGFNVSSFTCFTNKCYHAFRIYINVRFGHVLIHALNMSDLLKQRNKTKNIHLQSYYYSIFITITSFHLNLNFILVI